MPALNSPIPVIECFVRKEFLRDLRDGHGEVYPCVLFGVASLPSQTPLFHSLMEDGGVFWRLPIHAFCWKREAPPIELGDAVLWDAFSHYVSVTTFPLLAHKRVAYADRHKREHGGEYLFTLDWCSGDEGLPDLGFSETPGQHKAGHFIKRDDGNFAIQPNNRVRFLDPSFCTKTDKNSPPLLQRLLHSHRWSSEQQGRWVSEDSDRYDYQVLPTPLERKD